MKLKMQTQKYYKGDLTLLDDSEERFGDFGDALEWEKVNMELEPFGDESEAIYGTKDYSILFDINTLKNVMIFSEITRFRDTLLADMPYEERSKINQLIVDNLSKFHIKPIAYEIKRDVIVLAWYLENVISAFKLSENMSCLIDWLI